MNIRCAQIQFYLSVVWLAIFLSTHVGAHELWLEPNKYDTQLTDPLIVSIRNGENFNGDALPYVPAAFTKLSLENALGTHSIKAEMGAMPAIHERAEVEGLSILRYESVKNVLEYPSFEKFTQFANKEGVDWVLSAHLASFGQSEPVREIYRRFAKTLINVGTASGTDQSAGMELELVAIDNPYQLTGRDSLQLQLLYQGEPLPGAQVSTYTSDSKKLVERTIAITDQQGFVSIPRKIKRDYLVNAVHIRSPGLVERLLNGMHWETLWASLTFTIPADDYLQILSISPSVNVDSDYAGYFKQ